MNESGVLFTLFGATGDLARRELIPWIVELARKGVLGEPFRLLGVARDPQMDDKGFQKLVADSVAAAEKPTDDLAAWCKEHVRFHTAYEPGHYDDMARLVRSIEQDAGLPGNRAYYLSLPPSAFSQVIDELGRVGMARSPGWTRLVVEKPFGRDLDSARELNETVHRAFDESQIYRIDHFVGKETVQNLLVFRFANPLFEAVWNRDRIEHVQITVAEDIGIKARGSFYEQTGCLRDMVQNHLTQLLTMIAMEVPAAYDAESVRFEKVKVLRSMAPFEDDDVVFGQYAAGVVHGKPVHGYREEADVSPASQVETFVAVRAQINTWRWHGVPFYLRTGKRMPRRLTEIVVTFKEPPVRLFETMQCRIVPPNRLVIRLQPDEGFSLRFDVKRPGEPLLLENLPLHFDYAEAFGALPTAYETLLAEVVQGDQTLFVHADEVITSWKKYTPLLERGQSVHHYAAGSWGPSEADALLARNGHAWYVGQ